jgi:hypothetical protein
MSIKTRFAKYELVFDGQYTHVVYLGEQKRERVDGYSFFYSYKVAMRAWLRYYREHYITWKQTYQDAKRNYKKTMAKHNKE